MLVLAKLLSEGLLVEWVLQDDHTNFLHNVST